MNAPANARQTEATPLDLPMATSSNTTPSSNTSSHDKILIVDFGSQVTQLIARRVREEGVYCEIVAVSEG